MNRRVLAALAAVLLAILGGTLLIGYVGRADARAVAALEPVEVLVASVPIGEGTSAEALTESVTVKSIPGSAVAPGALTTLDDVAGMVTAGELVPGEQLASHRFVTAEVAAARTAVEVPAGLHQVTVQLDPVRVLGGHLTEGDTVGVFISLAAEAAGAEGEAATPAPGESGNQTHLVLHKALVTRVQGAVAPATPTADSDEVAPAASTEAAQAPAESVPTAQIMVTLALGAPDAEKLVYAAEFEQIWLSIEDDEASVDGTRAVTRENVYQ
ncbi:Flp pilus assembly protein CpaB [Georgenia daeguensis]|uniref:SAF domain-containing protein n=1 Tax=Georgenia daeguensis TaxID=908355 RepID=A0ABP8ER55_9MICO